MSVMLMTSPMSCEQSDAFRNNICYSVNSFSARRGIVKEMLANLHLNPPRCDPRFELRWNNDAPDIATNKPVLMALSEPTLLFRHVG